MDEAELVGLLARACERLVGQVFAVLDEAGFEGVGTTNALAVRTLAAGPMTAGALAAVLGVTPQAAGKVTTELEHQGLVERGVDPQDARARPLNLTDRGRLMAEAMAGAEAAAVERWRSAAGREDLEATTRALRAYLDSTPVPQAPRVRRLRFS
jgi:DNA-binding MarR family transcriptional regulator